MAKVLSARRFPIFVSLLVVAALVVAACSGSSATPTSAPAANASLPAQTAPPAPTATLLPTTTPTPAPPAPATPSIPDIVEKISLSVVRVQVEIPQRDFFGNPTVGQSVGTGEIIDTRGYVLTNNHVVEGGRRITVTLSGGLTTEAKLIGRDPATDLAVLQITAPGLQPIPLGKSSELRVGDDVIAIGHALDLPGRPSVTGGLVSALDRAIDVSPTLTVQHLIQTDAAINPGNSGGPLVNRRGQMVGINTAKIPGGEGIGFAIALDPVRPLIDELIEKGKIERGFVGISGFNITEAFARSQGLPFTSGVGITSVAAGSPAAKAGLQPGDVIARVAGRDVANLADLDQVLLQYRAGSTVVIEVMRFNQRTGTFSRVEASITLTERPQS